MATGYGTPVSFTKEKNVWFIFGAFNIGSGGAIAVASVPTAQGPQLITKGIANVWNSSPTFTGFTTASSSTITSISSLNGVYTGMSLQSPGTAVAGTGLTIGTVSQATNSIVVNGGSFAPGSSTIFAATGGQYVFQFGVNTSTGSISQMSRLDTYNRLLGYAVSWDATSGSVSAGIGNAVGTNFIDTNNLTQKTVPSTLTSNSTDATLVVQFGTGNGIGFVATPPAPGFLMRATFILGNTSGV